jgi:hypothetical protein
MSVNKDAALLQAAEEILGERRKEEVGVVSTDMGDFKL